MKDCFGWHTSIQAGTEKLLVEARTELKEATKPPSLTSKRRRKHYLQAATASVQLHVLRRWRRVLKLAGLRCIKACAVIARSLPKTAFLGRIAQ
jgi:hypothetical protein